MYNGKALTGPQSGERVVAIIAWLDEQGVPIIWKIYNAIPRRRRQTCCRRSACRGWPFLNLRRAPLCAKISRQRSQGAAAHSTHSTHSTVALNRWHRFQPIVASFAFREEGIFQPISLGERHSPAVAVRCSTYNVNRWCWSNRAIRQRQLGGVLPPSTQPCRTRPGGRLVALFPCLRRTPIPGSRCFSPSFRSWNRIWAKLDRLAEIISRPRRPPKPLTVQGTYSIAVHKVLANSRVL